MSCHKALSTPFSFPYDVTRRNSFEDVTPRLGLNAAIMAYGQTSTGKTHTMVGESGRFMGQLEKGRIRGCGTSSRLFCEDFVASSAKWR